MFSGIVAAIGRIERITSLADGVRLTVDSGGLDLADVIIGDSIANNGVCLTVVAIDGARLDFDVSRETLNCTVGLDAEGAELNLEKALRLADRLGGHLVTGHVDGVGEVLRFAPLGESHELVIRAPAAIAASPASTWARAAARPVAGRTVGVPVPARRAAASAPRLASSALR